jgi:hypothetical protein
MNSNLPLGAEDHPFAPYNENQGEVEFSVVISGTFKFDYNIHPLKSELEEAIEHDLLNILPSSNYENITIDNVVIV